MLATGTFIRQLTRKTCLPHLRLATTEAFSDLDMGLVGERSVQAKITQMISFCVFAQQRKGFLCMQKSWSNVLFNKEKASCACR